MASVRIGLTDAFNAVEGSRMVVKKAMSINRPRPDLLQRFGRRRRHQSIPVQVRV